MAESQKPRQTGLEGSMRTDMAVGKSREQQESRTGLLITAEQSGKGQDENAQIAEALDLLGFNLNEQRFSVLRIILLMQHKQGIPADFTSIHKRMIAENGNKNVPRSQVYRCLRSLENEGYINSDRSSHPHHYNATPEILTTALSDAKVEALRRLEFKRTALNSEIERLSGSDLMRDAIDTIEVATGVPSRTVSSFAEGHEQIRGLADSEVYSVTKKGDIIRVSLGFMRSAPNITTERIGALSEVVRRGATLKALLSKQWERSDSTTGPMTDAYRSLLQENRDVSIRKRTTMDATYQILARNNGGILLIVSEDPPAATYIPRSVNEQLVDDAIAGFDAEFDKAIELYPVSSWGAEK
jgi:sugar-specific transcriptional regulator TrmB